MVVGDQEVPLPGFFEEIGGPSFAPLAVAPDGDFAYVQGPASIGTYDVEMRRTLPDTAPLDANCGPASIMPLAQTRRVAAVCVGSQSVSIMQITSSGALGSEISYPFPVVADGRTDSFGNELALGSAHWAVTSEDATRLWLVTGNGHVFEVDTTDGDIVESADLRLGSEDFVPYGQVRLSDDGGSLLVGLQKVSAMIRGESVISDRILVVDTGSWAASEAVPAGSQITWFGLDAWGDIYVLDRRKPLLTVLDSQGSNVEAIIPLPGEPRQLVM
ncbi:MAG: hypothetical protein ACRDI0_01020 [Actinomycetota bacterium]